MRAVWTLEIDGTERPFLLAEGARLTIGRVPDCDIQLKDHAVSRRHCTIEARGDELIVTDLESANGTFLNDRLIRTSSIHTGDAIRVGATLVRVARGPAAGESATGPAAAVERDERLESVIRKRFEPARFDWLASLSSTAETGSGDLGLLDRAQRHLAVLHQVSESLATARDFTALADSTLAAILDVTGADRGAFLLRRKDPATGGAEVAVSKSRSADAGRLVVSSSLIADVIDRGLSTFAYDAVEDERFRRRASVVDQQVRSVMCVPLRTTDQVLGALYVDTVSAPGKFAEADLELLAAIGNQAGVALHRVRLMGELERLLIDTVRAIAATIDAKDGYTHRHSERVAALAQRIASAVGLSRDEQQTVQLAALLHDVGKIAVPDSILNKPGRLTAEEFEEMKKHPLHGAEILANIKSAAMIAVLPGVQHHHERWDGSGYPGGLRGEEIPFL